MKEKMPTLFVGHGSPMNAIEDNEFTKEWRRLGKEIPKPKAILMVSAHWYTDGSKINDSEEPTMIYDMYGFPDELYQQKHPVKGHPLLARETIKLVSKNITIDNSWGYDHGTWSVLVHMYPNAEIPVFQLSIDHNLTMEEHFKIGQKLSILREQGVLIMGSGNIVHNLSLANFHEQGGYPWAYEFDNYIKDKILSKDFEGVINYQQEPSSKLAFFTKEHYIPLLYVLGAAQQDDQIEVFNDKCLMGSISMTGYLFK